MYTIVSTALSRPRRRFLSLDKGLLSTTGIFFSFFLLRLTLSIRRALTITTTQLSYSRPYLIMPLFVHYFLSLFFYCVLSLYLYKCICMCVAGPIRITLNDLLFYPLRSSNEWASFVTFFSSVERETSRQALWMMM